MKKDIICPQYFLLRGSAFIVLTICLLVSSCRNGDVEGDRAWNDLTAPFRKTADMGGYKMHYIDIGKGEPVVMIHGFADSSYCWHKNAAVLLDAGFRLIMMDQPGQGRSDIPPEPYVFSIENQAREIIRLTELLKLKKFLLVGHSMGGGIGLYIMANHPGRVIRAVLINPVCFTPPGVQLLKIPGMEFMAQKLGGRWSVRLGLEDAFFDGGQVTKAMVDEYSRPLNKPGYVKVLVSLEKQFFSPEFGEMGKHYKHIMSPVMIIWGKEDTWLPLSQGRELNEMINDSSIMEIDKCGHVPHQECRDKVNPLVVNFLSEQ